MKLKIILILLIMNAVTYNLAYSQGKDFGYTGFYAGTYDLSPERIGADGYLGGAIGFYFSEVQLENTYSKIVRQLGSNLGVIGSLAYFADPEADFSFTVQLSKGIWLGEKTLLQGAVGPSLSNANSIGVSMTALVSSFVGSMENNLNSGTVFIQGDRYKNDEIGGVKWRLTFGISLGVGSMNIGGVW